MQCALAIIIKGEIAEVDQHMPGCGECVAGSLIGFWNEVAMGPTDNCEGLLTIGFVTSCLWVSSPAAAFFSLRGRQSCVIAHGVQCVPTQNPTGSSLAIPTRSLVMWGLLTWGPALTQRTAYRRKLICWNASESLLVHPTLELDLTFIEGYMP
jgi:hypothetical protein